MFQTGHVRLNTTLLKNMGEELTTRDFLYDDSIVQEILESCWAAFEKLTEKEILERKVHNIGTAGLLGHGLSRDTVYTYIQPKIGNTKVLAPEPEHDRSRNWTFRVQGKCIRVNLDTGFARLLGAKSMEESFIVWKSFFDILDLIPEFARQSALPVRGSPVKGVRPRGRPRKPPLPDPNAPKRPRGRPRKSV